MATMTGTDAAQSTRTSPALTLHHWVAGADHEGSSDRFSDVTNPATGETGHGGINLGFPQNV
jgi:hypothetical protein